MNLKMKKLSLDAFSLKIIAIVTMGIQHIMFVFGEVIPNEVLFPMAVVRWITFPIMAFFVVEGFKRTTHIKKYMLRLLVFATVSQIPYMMAFRVFIPPLNIIFTILSGLILLILYDNLYVKKQKRLQFGIVFVITIIASQFVVEGGLGAVLLIFLMYVIKGDKKRIVIPLILWGTLMGLISAVPALGPFIAIPLLLAYNGKRGIRAKYLFYGFYPLHLLILAFIS